MTVSWWTVYLLDQLSRRVSGNDKREGNQYYNVLPVSSENGLDDRESLSHPHTAWFSVQTPMCVLIYGYASLQNKIWHIFTPTWHKWQWNHTHTGHKTYGAHTRWKQHEEIYPCTTTAFKVSCPLFKEAIAFTFLALLKLSSFNWSLFWSALSFNL